MRFHILATLSIYLSLTASVHATSPRHQAAKASSHHGSRRERLFRDITVAFNSLMSPRKSLRSLRPRNVLKRGAAVNANHQCVLKASNGLTPAGGGQSPATRTQTLSGSSTSTGSAGATQTATPSPNSTWVKKFEAAGQSFFDGWSFREGADFTHGAVMYQSQANCSANNLTYIDSNGYAVMRVETTPQVQSTRMSVRIESNVQFTGGLWILDAVHMPAGCATWPAFWTVGPGWPNNGEIDIVEGVNGNTHNQISLHTRDGCNLTPNSGYTGTMIDGTTCNAAGDNSGCGLMDTNGNSYGSTFNSNGGGAYAMLWDPSVISVWFFPRGSIPSDISNQAPNPSGWGAPTANWPASSCNPYEFFNDHTTIFDTTLCGDWAGGAWGAAPNSGAPSCQQSTGYSTCAAYVAANGSAFSEAYWRVKSVRIYQSP